MRLTGDLDLAGVDAVREQLLGALAAAGPVVLDLRGLASVASSGLGLLLEATAQRGEGSPADLLLPETGTVRRALELTGLIEALLRRQ